MERRQVSLPRRLVGYPYPIHLVFNQRFICVRDFCIPLPTNLQLSTIAVAASLEIPSPDERRTKRMVLPNSRSYLRRDCDYVCGRGTTIRDCPTGLRSVCPKHLLVHRKPIWTQMDSSGLRVSYNVAAEQYGFHIPHGTLILWVLSCAQICYGFTMRPDSLPHGYRTWIGKAIRIPLQTVEINDSLVRKVTMDVGLLDKVIALPVRLFSLQTSTTASHRTSTSIQAIRQSYWNAEDLRCYRALAVDLDMFPVQFFTLVSEGVGMSRPTSSQK